MAQRGYEFLFDVEANRSERVFLDPTFVRRRKLRRILLALIISFAAWVIVFLEDSFSLRKAGEEVRFWLSAEHLQDEASVTERRAPRPHTDLHEIDYQRPDSPDGCLSKAPPAFSASAEGAGLRLFGHVPVELEWAPLSLENSCGLLDVVMPNWLTILAGSDGPELDLTGASTREPVEDYLRSSESPAQTLPIVTLQTGDNIESFLAQLAAPETANVIASSLVSVSEVLDASGLCFDLQQLTLTHFQAVDPFLKTVSTLLKSKGLASCIVLSGEQDVWADQNLMRHYDNIILKMFRRSWVGSVPGPIAPDAWFEDMSARALKAIGPQKLTLAIGNFAVEWTQNRALPVTYPYAEEIGRIARANAAVKFSPEVGNSFSSYRTQSGESRRTWLLDAASAHNQILMLRALGVRNVGIWSLGQEDPGLWHVLSENYAAPSDLGAQLSSVSFPDYVSYQGKGPFLRILSESKPGLRFAEFDTVSSRITDLVTIESPQPFLLERYGRAPPDKLVLTFDDGPNANYTAAILNTLKETKTPASFFVVGTQVMGKPELLRRMVDEGHEIGSHSFSHPHMDKISQSRTDLEHSMMNKLIAGYTGYNTRLYREPFLRAGGPIEQTRVRSLLSVQNAGDIIAGMEIVPKDWEGMSAEAIASYVIAEVETGAGNVILLHDGGQNRAATVAAVPLLIANLKAKGYEFTTLANLLGVQRDAVMPLAAGKRLLFDRLSFGFLSMVWLSLEAIFWIVLCIGVVRTLLIFTLAHFRHPVILHDTCYMPKVAVVIPAYDEESAIAWCIRSVLKSTYSNIEVMVVDDGSKDETFSEALKFQNNPKVSLFAQLNRGKWSALNSAIDRTDAEIVICIDADTEVEPDAIRYLVRHFANPKVGAVAGKITVKNREKLLTRLQALEYATAQNFDRRAFDPINGLMVVPGAIGAWRTEAIKEAGLYCNDTITEDADLTLSVIRTGYRVTYEEKAIARTEAPESIPQLLAQRLRWSLGMFQCAWKHKKASLEGRTVGLVTLPDMLIFGYIFPLLAPLADLFILILFYQFLWGEPSGGVASQPPYQLVAAYMILPLLDFAVAAYALKTDRAESMKLLLLFPFQRIFYRQLMYLSVYRSVFRAASGGIVGWGRTKQSQPASAVGVAR